MFLKQLINQQLLVRLTQQVRDAGAKVGQRGQRGMQGTPDRKRAKWAEKFGGPGILPGKVFGATPFKLCLKCRQEYFN